MNLSQMLPESIALFDSEKMVKPAPKETRKEQTCALCQNHKISVPKRGHKKECPYDTEIHIATCTDGCDKSKLRQKASALEKKKLYTSERGFRKNDKVLLTGRQRQEQECRRCKIHGRINVMRSHRRECPYKNCHCEKCSPTLQRQRAVRDEAKDKRHKNRLMYDSEGSIKSEPSSGDSNCGSSSPFSIGETDNCFIESCEAILKKSRYQSSYEYSDEFKMESYKNRLYNASLSDGSIKSEPSSVDYDYGSTSPNSIYEANNSSMESYECFQESNSSYQSVSPIQMSPDRYPDTFKMECDSFLPSPNIENYQLNQFIEFAFKDQEEMGDCDFIASMINSTLDETVLKCVEIDLISQFETYNFQQSPEDSFSQFNSFSC